MKKFLQSLLAKYMLIILIAISLIQISFFVIALFVMGVIDTTEEAESPAEIEEQWHEEAGNIENITKREIRQHFEKWKQQYPEASMFWVNEDGKLVEELDTHGELPSEWTANYTASFIKERYGGEPFTVIAFVGEDQSNGFIVFEVPRDLFLSPMQHVFDDFGVAVIVGMVLIVLLFIFISYLFFHRIRKRLVHLQKAMSVHDVDGLPLEIDVKKKDEIGQLEQTFNQMVVELRESKKREQKEEQLRRELIANLSHDLRTPLTKINAQTHLIEKEELSPKVTESLLTLKTSIEDMDQLIDNLMSYTLLMASKYQIERKEIDVVRYVRESLATWYPVFEKEGFDINVNLDSFKHNDWYVDPVWLGRIMDNILQNILRHAKSGKYIEVRTESTEQYDAFVFTDRGKGMQHQSIEKGVGIGLSIIDMMVKGMDLDWNIDSSESGTTIKIKRQR